MIRFRKDDKIFNGQYISVDGAMIINPTEAMLEQYGYVREEYEPEVPVSTQPDPSEVTEKLKELVKEQVAEFDDKKALEFAALYPTWAESIGRQVAQGERLWYDGRLYKVLQAHTVQEQWKPGIDTASLYVQIADTTGDPTLGTAGNPIPFEINMELEEGKYYEQDGVTYKCVRALAACYWALSAIVGNYVEKV